MPAASIANQICTFFGGAYDATTHTYRTPQLTIPNASPVVRRAAPKRDDHQEDYYAAATDGMPVGCLILVLIEGGSDTREAPGQPGIREVRHTIRMHAFLRCLDSYAEDAQDTQYALLDAVRAKLLTDPTCGSGGFEAGYLTGFQVGEASRGQSWFRWTLSPVETTPRELSKAYLQMEFEAVEIAQA